MSDEAEEAEEAADAMNEAAEAAGVLAEAFGAAAAAALNARAAFAQAGESAEEAGEGASAFADALGAAAGAAAVVVTGVVAAAAGFAALASVAIDVNEKLAMMQTRFAALAGSAQGGKQVTAMVDHLSQTLPFATDQIARWSQSLMAAGITGKELEKAVKAVAAATALMGEEGGAAAENMIKKLAEGGKGAESMVKTIQQGGSKANKLLADMGLSTADVAKAMGMTPAQFAKAKISAEQMGHAVEKALQKKGAGPLDEMMGSMPVMMGKAKEGILSLFSGLNLGPLMNALKGLFGEFGKGGAATSALKPIVTGVFSTLVGWATKAVDAVKSFIDNFIKSGGAAATLDALNSVWDTLVGAFDAAKPTLSTIFDAAEAAWDGLVEAFNVAKPIVLGLWDELKASFDEVSTALDPAIASFKKLFSSFSSGESSGSTLQTVFSAIGAVVSGVITVVTFVITGLIGAFTAVADGASAFIAGFQATCASIADFVTGAIDTIAGLPAAAMNAASNFVSGLVEGIQAGASQVIAAVSGLASSALGAFTGALGIHSPSTIMLEHGEDNIAGAAATGINKGGAKVDKAMEGLTGGRPKAGGGKRGEGGGEVHYHYSGPVDHYPTFRENMQRFLEETGSAQSAAEVS